MAEPLHDSSPTASTAGERTGGPDRADLVRRFEPVIRFTAGELFFPMPVEAYVGHSALWERTPGMRRPVRVVDHGELDLETLCRAARSRTESALELRYVPRPLNRGESKQWRRDPNRVRFRSTSRFAAVGLLGRVLDSLFRLSLVLRGAVPGGLTAALHREYSTSPAASKFPYYAHVSDHAGYVVIQYWFCDERLALDLRRRERPRGRLGAGLGVPGARPARRRYRNCAQR